MPPPDRGGGAAQAGAASLDYLDQLNAEIAPILQARGRELPPLGQDTLSQMLEVLTAAAINPGSATDRQKMLSILSVLEHHVRTTDGGERFMPLHRLLVALIFGLAGLDDKESPRVEAIVAPAEHKGGRPVLRYPQLVEILLFECMAYQMRLNRGSHGNGRRAAAGELERLSGVPAVQFLSAYRQRAPGKGKKRAAAATLTARREIKDANELANAIAEAKQRMAVQG